MDSRQETAHLDVVKEAQTLLSTQHAELHLVEL